VSLDAHAALHHPGFQETTNDPQQALVANAPRQACHENVVVDHDLAPVGDVALGLGKRLMGAQPRAKAKTR